MSRRLPSLRALEAFEAAARHQSVTRAATELGVTQPAVTQQLRRLEAALGVTLLRRLPSGIALTAEGRAYAARLRHAFDELRAATEDLVPASRRTNAVSVSVLATFAQRWLIPRLGRFRVGDGRWPGRRCDYLMANEAFPVASPSLMQRRPLATAAALADHVLIRVEAEPRHTDWPRWLAAAGVAELEPRSWLGFANSAHALEAAVAGLGLAIGHTPFVADALASDRLLAPLPTRLGDLGACYLVGPEDKAEIPRIARFREWLLAETRKDDGATAHSPR
jgi:LysR family glycine cleavage system transcriptional activator